MAAAQQGGGQSDNSMAILWWVFGLFAIIGGIWYFLKDKIIVFYLTTKIYEIDLLRFLSRFLPFDMQKLEQAQSGMRYVIENHVPISFSDLMILGSTVGDILRVPLMLIFIVLAFIVYTSNTTRSFKRIYTMRTFMKLEKQNWPQISPVVDVDLLKQDIDVGPWAMAMTPMQFCKKFHLLDEIRYQKKGAMAAGRHDKIDVVLKRDKASRLFASQLGPLWTNVNALPPHVRALFAGFAARINADSKSAAQLFKQLAESPRGNLNYAGVDELIKKHINTKLVKRIIESHAYVYTVMAAMLEGARDDGVQPSADFLWLKPMDRRLWYTLNTVGRQTPFIEVAGIFAHWVAEKTAQRKLLVPMIEQATNATELALKEVVYKPDEE